MIKLVLMIHHRAGRAGKGLEKIIRDRFPKVEQEFYENCGSFFKRLCRPIRCGEDEICIVLADTRERLEQLMGLKKFFERRKLLLILPENQKEILSMGHRLLPRYVSNVMDNYEEMVSVIEKMMDVLDSSDRDDAPDDPGIGQGPRGGERPASV